MITNIQIGIIGFGLSGLSVLEQLLRTELYNNKLQITIFEKYPERLAKGLAYNASQKGYLLNRDVKRISIFKKHDYYKWLERNSKFKNIGNERSTLGVFLFESFKILMTKSTRSNINISVSYGEVTNITKKKLSYVVHSVEGKRHPCDYVVLSTGMLTQCDNFDRSKIEYTRDDIYLLGSRLSAIDVIYQCHKLNLSNKIHMLSRSGLTNSVFKPFQGKLVPLTIPNRGSISLKGLYRILLNYLKANNCLFYFKKHYRKYSKDPENFFLSCLYFAINSKYTWHDFLSVAHEKITQLWYMMSEQEKNKLRNIQSSIICYRVGMPISMAKIIKEKLENNTLTINKFDIGTSSPNKLPGLVINCLGNLNKQSILSDKLLHNLHSTGLISSADTKTVGLKLVPHTYQVLSNRNQEQDKFYVIGNLTQAIDFYASQVECCLSQASKVVKSIQEQICSYKFVPNRYHLKRLGLNGIPAILNFRNEILQGLTNSDAYVREENEYNFVKHHLIGKNRTYGIYLGEKLIAYSCVGFPDSSSDELFKNAKLKTTPFTQVAYLSATMVHPDYRGHSFQKHLISIREQHALQEDIDIMLCMVSPANNKSINNLKCTGYVLCNEAELCGGLSRLIFYKKLQVAEVKHVKLS